MNTTTTIPMTAESPDPTPSPTVCAPDTVPGGATLPWCFTQKREREKERAVVYGIDRAAFNCGANAQFDFPITEEVSTVLRARGPNAVAVPTMRQTNER